MVDIDLGLKNYIMLSSEEVIAKPNTRELDENIIKQKRIVSRRYQVPYMEQTTYDSLKSDGNLKTKDKTP